MIYIYEHPDTKEIKEVNQGMNDIHEYVDETGLKWNRVFTIPNACIDTKIDPFSKNDFLRKTDKKGSVGDLVDRAKDLSEQRKDKNGGVDPILNKEISNYKKKYNVLHPSELKKL